MIALVSPEEQFTSFADKVAQAHMQFTEIKFTEALLAKFGEMPSKDEIREHCVRYIDPEGVTHFIWHDVKPEAGTKVDLAEAFCRIEPPNFGGPQ